MYMIGVICGINIGQIHCIFVYTRGALFNVLVICCGVKKCYVRYRSDEFPAKYVVIGLRRKAKKKALLAKCTYI